MDTAKEQLDGSETPSPSVAIECEALEVEKEKVPQLANDTVVFADDSDQEVVSAEIPAVASEHPDIPLHTATSSTSVDWIAEKVVGDTTDAVEESPALPTRPKNETTKPRAPMPLKMIQNYKWMQDIVRGDRAKYTALKTV